MHIIFNSGKDGFGNNGGSRTLIRCAETLAGMGHDVSFYASAFRYNWHKVNNVSIILSKKNPCPPCDLLITASHRDVGIAKSIKAKHKLYYIRGFETWKATEKQLIKGYKSHICIVNSIWLKNKLERLGIKSKIIYQGLDFNLFHNLRQRRGNTIGAIFHVKHKTKRHVDAEKVAKMSGYPLVLLNKDIKGPSPVVLNQWYNKLKIWFAPTELEGLHNPPMEAAMAGCAIIRTDHPRCGMADYAVDKESALVYPARDLKAAARCIERLMSDYIYREQLNHNMIDILKNVIGSREENMHKLLEYVRSL